MKQIEGKRVSIIGASRSGLGLAYLLKAKGARVFVSENSLEKKDSIGELERLGVDFEIGEHSKRVLDADFIAVSPGVSLDIPILSEARERGISIYGEIEVASWFSNVPIYAVTGTNGKSTTVTLLDLMLKASGMRSILAGNIGYPFSRAVLEQQDADCYVLEVSSYQLETIEKFSPKIAAILNVTPDHLDRHKTMENYLRAKLKIASNQKEEDSIWVNASDNLLKDVNFVSQKYLFWKDGLPERGAGVIDSKMIVLGEEIIKVSEIKLKGPHNLENSLCASGMAYQAGAKKEAIAKVLREFSGLEHRLEFVAEIDGVTYINDSKGTNVVSTLMALDSFEAPIILIAGGRGKKAGYEKLAKKIIEKVRVLVLLGEDGPIIKEAVQREGFSEDRIFSVSSMEEAVSLAHSVARRGEIVLLSPACASFDMFSNFEERGRVFKRAVLNLQKDF
ncbi:MAG: UDP-N-acetylmuramoyl-L-alanine--D-glutamate ligase [Synergistetes bacterium]|nr:UDP-N-acetylmuramoyl-L-alanine--D-glutamate ligase [Synergistota bacterium]MCX8127785.1 UDP-N-acetylmuramoyl-L-alanine--D-glutamate ligase [Synergistota bacterium]MDW8192047.1 UDP-N-acetylmuramoyl-L-alanine--D-glutamate ligase [Synergistota bacterium]